MSELSSKEYEKINEVFSDFSKINREEYKGAIKKFKSFLRINNIECVVANTNQILFAYGKKVKDALGCVPADDFMKLLSDVHLGGSRSAWLKITNKIFVRKKYYYSQLKLMKNYASMVLFFNDKSIDAVHNILDNIKVS